MRIVEQRDASPDELEITEVNTSIYCFRRSLLAPALRRIEPDNSQGEYYLTDVVEVLASAGHPVEAFLVEDAAETQGVNDRLQLAAAEHELRSRTNESLLRSGVTMVDPASVYVDTTVVVGRDVTLFPGVILQGSTRVAARHRDRSRHPTDRHRRRRRVRRRAGDRTQRDDRGPVRGGPVRIAGTRRRGPG